MNTLDEENSYMMATNHCLMSHTLCYLKQQLILP